MATPRPMPVLPSSSRLRMARTMSSMSVPRNWPASRRLSTMARMTPSLVVADSDGMMASRTTNSDIRMMLLPSLLSRVERGRPGHVAGRGRPAVVLDRFLVAAELALQLVHGQVHRGDHVVVGVLGDEVVLVFRLDEKLDPGLVFLGLLDIDRHLDHREAVEDVGELEGLLA